MFKDDEIDSILSDFPKFELSYETMTHKKVFNHNVIYCGEICDIFEFNTVNIIFLSRMHDGPDFLTI